MTKPHVRGKVVPASRLIDALGNALSRIKSEEGLTWADIGAAIGKSDDRSALYAAGAATMDVVTFYRAKRVWNGRFTGDADKLIEESRGEADPRHVQSCVLKAALALSVALEDDDLTDEEIRANRSTLVNARDEIDKVLARIAPKQVA